MTGLLDRYTDELCAAFAALIALLVVVLAVTLIEAQMPSTDAPRPVPTTSGITTDVRVHD